jgi:BirA family biotin operon repressor/biotin-[acetyl-CoA-carboxylase] ligase
MSSQLTEDWERVRREGLVDRVEHYSIIGSTQDRARQLAGDDAGEKTTLIVAQRQTAGRGQRARQWWTGEGALAFSLLLAPQMVPTGQASGLLALAMSLAKLDSLATICPPGSLGIHWPNDLFLSGKKVGGILAERLATGHAILGVGLNTNNSIANAPPDLRSTAVTIWDTIGHTVDHVPLVLLILGNLFANLRGLSNSPERIAQRANKFCGQRGRELRVRTADELLEGMCHGIDDEGALLLETKSGLVRIASGSIIRD